jgi:zinc D-Ala-D-Ala carboxypeptidase
LRIAPHFSLVELTRTGTHLDNSPTDINIQNLRRLAETVLEPIRELLGGGLNIHSAFRCFEVNRAVGGTVASAHLEGRAADFIPESQEPVRLAFDRILNSEIPFDKMLLEFKGSRYWIHIQIPEENEKPRRQAFICQVSGSGMHCVEVKNDRG